MSNPCLITIIGPTASGKTAFAARLAFVLDGEIISADSRQVYRGMDIGTGKDYSDYIVEGHRIPVNLIDIVDAGYKYSLFEFQKDFVHAWHGIKARAKQPILCGGSGMYIESVLGGYMLVNVPHDEKLRKVLENKTHKELIDYLSSLKQLHNVSDTSSRKRLIRAIEIAEHTNTDRTPESNFPRFDKIILGIAIEREHRRRRITERLDARLDEGLVDEVKGLLGKGITPDDLIFYGLEYKYVTLFLLGKMTWKEMRIKLNTAIHQFSKRQMTWFRKMERNGYKIHWIDASLSMKEKLDRALEITGRQAR